MKKFLIALLILIVMLSMFIISCEPDPPPPEFDNMTDERDNQVYEIVKIGSQWWTAQNMNYETDNSYCYDDDPENCEIYGRLYGYEAAVNDACPAGWRLASDEDWSTLIRTLDRDSDPSEMTESKTAGYEMKSQSGWDGDGNGSNSSGFSAVPNGNRGPEGTYHSLGSSAYIWSSTPYDDEEVWRRVIQAFDNGIFRVKHGSLGRSLAVRCVKE